ncbi:MAG: hypothetical protein MJ136_03095, partial [Clostridia bacterium]|nr:hypothetical protein [Clostridia bacterium]
PLSAYAANYSVKIRAVIKVARYPFTVMVAAVPSANHTEHTCMLFVTYDLTAGGAVYRMLRCIAFKNVFFAIFVIATVCTHRTYKILYRMSLNIQQVAAIPALIPVVFSVSLQGLVRMLAGAALLRKCSAAHHQAQAHQPCNKPLHGFHFHAFSLLFSIKNNSSSLLFSVAFVNTILWKARLSAAAPYDAKQLKKFKKRCRVLHDSTFSF